MKTTEEIDGCENCKHNIPGLEEGYYCINNCINGSQFEAMGNVKYSRQQTQPKLPIRDEVKRLREALEQIANPIEWMRKQLLPGEQLNGQYAVMISNDANQLKQWATKALQQTQPSSIKEEKVSTETFEQEAERLYPLPDGVKNNIEKAKPEQKEMVKFALFLRRAHIKASQLHCTTGLDLFIKWIEYGMMYGYSNQQKSTLQKVITKAKEIKERLNK